MMMISFFGKKYNLSDKQSEILKIAILDSIRQAEHEQSVFEAESKEYAVLQNKISELNGLAEFFGLVNV